MLPLGAPPPRTVPPPQTQPQAQPQTQPQTQPPGPAADAPLASDDGGRRRRRRMWMLAVGGLASLAVLGAIVFVASDTEPTGPVDLSKLPVIHADERPFKSHPENPGGIEVPNRDKLIYHKLKNDEAAVKVERLIPEPEKPVPPPAPPPLASPPSAASPPPHEGPVSGVGSPLEPSEGVADRPADGIPAPKPRSGGERVAAAPGAAFRIQIGSLAAADKASAEWRRLSARHADLLGGLSAEIARADLGERGIVFRLRAGPIASKEEAQALCHSLAGRGVNCIVVAPRG